MSLHIGQKQITKRTASSAPIRIKSRGVNEWLIFMFALSEERVDIAFEKDLEQKLTAGLTSY